MKRFLLAQWRSLARMRSAVLLLAIIAGLSVIATLLPQRATEPQRASDYITAHHTLGPLFDRLGFFAVYESWPLIVAAVLMYLSLGNCVYTRGRALYKRWRKRLPRNPQFVGEAGSLVFHLSFFVLLVGILYNLAGGFTAFVNVVEGDSVVEARASYDQVQEGMLFSAADHKGFEVKVDRFDAAYYANGKPSDFVTRAEVFDQGRKVMQKDIRVNQYLEYKGVKFYQASYGWAPELVITDPSGKAVFDEPVLFFGQPQLANGVLKAPAAGPPGKQLGARMFFVPDLQVDASGQAQAGTANLRNPAVSFLFFEGDLHSEVLHNVYDLDVNSMHEIWKGTLLPGQNATLPNGDTVTFTRVLRYTGLQVTDAPGLPIIWGSFGLMLGGLLVRLYVRPLLEWRAQRKGAQDPAQAPAHVAA